MQEITNEVAKKILLTSTQIYHDFRGGIPEVLQRLGSVQLDTIPVAGRNHDLVLQARDPSYRVNQFLAIAHEKRLGFEYMDKALCMIRIDDFPYFARFMENGGLNYYQKREETIRAEYPRAFDEVLSQFETKNSLSSKEVYTDSPILESYSGWKSGKVHAMVLECLWNRGALVTHHREAYRRYFSFPEQRIPSEYLNAENSLTNDEMYQEFLTRRINQMGLLAVRGNSESLGILSRINAKTLNKLVNHGEFIETKVTDGSIRKYLTTREIFEAAENTPDLQTDDRIRFIGPLDPVVWDRKLAKDIFAFDYIWEVYKPKAKRIWGYYCLPVLYRDKFIGRIDPKIDHKSETLRISNAYFEKGITLKEEIRESLIRALELFCDYLGAKMLIFEGKNSQWEQICTETSLSEG